MPNNNIPPGAPGLSARWTSSAISGLGKSFNESSNVIFTISHGILDERYYPGEDIASTRVHTWCTLCLVSAVLSLSMVIPAIKELSASLHLIKTKRSGESFWEAVREN